MKRRTYIAIDLKSFYASVECRERGLDPLDTNLVVADESRTDKTICLAVTPSLKTYGISGRARLFEVVQQVREANRGRLHDAPGHRFSGKSCFLSELTANPTLEIDYLIAPPRMAYYMEYSSSIYSIYLKYIAPEDIIVYSIDEVFMDVTDYLFTYKLTAHDLAMKIILDVLDTTGITATAGIGTNLFLAKVAMDIVAKHIPADRDGVRIAELDTQTYRRQLWSHRPLTDFWRVGRATERKLQQVGLFTMGDIARCSLGKPEDYYNEDLLYDLFGVSAELLIDHAWGWEPCTLADIRAYRPENRSISSGQVLLEPYDFEHGRVIIREMAEKLSLELFSRRLVTDQLVLDVGYDIDNVENPDLRAYLRGKVTLDRYGRKVPRPAHGSENLTAQTASTEEIIQAAVRLYDRIADRRLTIRRFNLSASHTVPESAVKKEETYEQMDLFTDYDLLEKQRKQEQEKRERERKMQEAVLAIKNRFGKNAVVRGTSFEEGATGRRRNEQIGGHQE
ncbi:Y-family DNA polymerase [Porcincola intestinalis]|uniref:Y-family DNA polymerase n=1 Tax=Porcincola intestinalis TaxID=2606632 RepID=UPI0023F2B32B|nr:DNA methylase [Porcincola intestinalis]MDD7060124.1 DNA methylase [Porcincola intestinalis]MDY5282803.1 DNA methylase [Porcincola intestinalis]